jgi:hypothetical protein
MLCGKKRTAESIVYRALEMLEKQVQRDAVTAAAVRDRRQYSNTRCSIGLPPMSAITLPGNRDDSSRAGTATTNLIQPPGRTGRAR